MSTDSFLFCVHSFSFCRQSFFVRGVLLSRQAVGALSPRWLGGRRRILLLVVFLTVEVQIYGFPHHKEDAVVNVSQHRAVVLGVGGLDWLFLHLQEEQMLFYDRSKIYGDQRDVNMNHSQIKKTYLYVEAKVNNRRPDVFVAEFNWELIGHVLKVVQQWTWRNIEDLNYETHYKTHL